MRCPKCIGIGRTLYPPKDGGKAYIGDCDRCHGTGEIEVTNEEYIRSCSTEQLATLIYGISMYDILCDRIRNAMIMNPLCDDETAGVDEVKKWLKENLE